MPNHDLILMSAILSMNVYDEDNNYAAKNYGDTPANIELFGIYVDSAFLTKALL